jgi:hypothetical protein
VGPTPPQIPACDYNPLDHSRQFHEFVGRLALANDEELTEHHRQQQPKATGARERTEGPRTRFARKTTNLVRIGDGVPSTVPSSSRRRTMPLL